MYERVLLPTLARGRRNVLLLGPRQVGKSTLLSSLEPDLTINLASPATFRDYVTQPERLELELRAADRAVRTVFIDEVQRVPALLDAVQVLVDDQPRRFRFLLSGSSARKLRRGQANLLPGRIHLHHLHPLLASELAGDFAKDLRHVFFFRYVQIPELRGASPRLDFLDDSLARIVQEIRHRHPRAFLRQEQAGGTPDSQCAAGYDCYLSFDSPQKPPLVDCG